MKEAQEGEGGNTESKGDPPSIPEFITGVLNKARKQKGADAELLDILENRIVHADLLLGLPVAALNDIELLAEKRSKVDDTPDKENDGG